MKKYLHTIQEVRELIDQGKHLLLAADEQALSQLPVGNWVGGSIPYFVEDRGLSSRDMIFTTVLEDFAESTEYCCYDEKTIVNVYKDTPHDGFTFLLIPAFSSTHRQFALRAPQFEDFAMAPVIGWVTGVHLNELGYNQPKVYCGNSADNYSTSKCLAVKVHLPKGKMVAPNIINIFEPGNGDKLEFPGDDFVVQDVLVNGQQANFYDYLHQNGVDTRLPLVSDYNGSMINVSFKRLDERTRLVYLYAPVFKGVEYRLAKPVDNYLEQFRQRIPKGIDERVAFSCNCILNYIYSSLEGKDVNNLAGPATFGEIAYQLLNQTLVYLEIIDTVK